jgi:hypothetical protein
VIRRCCIDPLSSHDLSSTESPRGFSNLLFHAASKLLQLRVLRLGFFQDGDVGVGVFPKRQKILTGCLGFGGIALHGVGAGDAKMGERPCRAVPQQATTVENVLKFCNCGRTLLCAQVSLGADLHGIQTGVGSSVT